MHSQLSLPYVAKT